MYEYFKDDYIAITDKEVSLLLTNKKVSYDGGTTQSAYEDTYCFFNTDINIDELLSIDYMYEKITYEVDSNAIWNTMLNIDASGTPTIENSDIYHGLYKNNINNNKMFKVYGYNELYSSYYIYSIKAETEVKKVERPYFLWWKQDVTYKLNTIQNCLDTTNLNGDENKGFLNFISDIQDKRIEENKSKFQWCFKADSSLRELTKVEKVGGWWLFGGDYHAYTKCHEVMQVKTLRLQYRSNNQEFEFNTLDIPSDTSSIYTQKVPFKTLVDEVIDNSMNVWNWISKIFNDFTSNSMKILSVLFVCIVIVLLWPIIKFLINLINSSIKFVYNKIKNNKAKKE